MAYLWFALACFFAWRVWLYRKTLQEATEVVNELEAHQTKQAEELRLKQEESDRLNEQVHALRRELQQHEVRYKESQQTVGTLARQWENLQIKHEQTVHQLNGAWTEVDRYKSLAVKAEHDAKASIESAQLQLEARWQEADERVARAEEEADQIVMSAQEEAEHIGNEIELAKKEKKLLLQTLEQLTQEIETLNTGLTSKPTALEMPGGMMMKAVTKQLNKQRPKVSETGRRSNRYDTSKEDGLSIRTTQEPSPPSQTPPAAGVAVRSETITRPGGIGGHHFHKKLPSQEAAAPEESIDRFLAAKKVPYASQHQRISPHKDKVNLGEDETDSRI
jgi:chromosome segregation ATPase